MPRASGTISVVQEGRFRLDLGDGRSLPLVLHRHSRTEPQDLAPLQQQGIRVRVDYAEAPGRSGAVAYAVHVSGDE